MAEPIATPPAVAAICPKRDGCWGTAAGTGVGLAGGGCAGTWEVEAVLVDVGVGVGDGDGEALLSGGALNSHRKICMHIFRTRLKCEKLNDNRSFLSYIPWRWTGSSRHVRILIFFISQINT